MNDQSPIAPTQQNEIDGKELAAEKRKKNKQALKEDKQKRMAAALRANLRRRKLKEQEAPSSV